MNEERLPRTDEEALQWLKDKPQVARDLYLLYRDPQAFNMDVQTALIKTLKACIPATPAEIEREEKQA